ncbi:uncharacterized protein LOC114365429 [Ostrinia furnacalis]|uniref:uncharacterized protein LOC114365429 n=1 Tax=Ostrinia furnacalis TaxID=93504 RepID=UPI0010402BD6|nr:uncharacterized protein LOC114365429 [Ostrinia furnacalis]
MSLGLQWSQDQILLFLETLQSEPVIWDPSNRGHKDRKSLNDAWARISDTFGVSVPLLKRKKESLNATYRAYRRKVESSMKSGDNDDFVYRPTWFAYEYMDSFLGQVYNKQIKTDQRDETEKSIEEIAEERENSPPPRTDPLRIRKIIKRPIIHLKPSASVSSTPNPDFQIASRQMTEAFNNLNKIIKSTQGKTDPATTEDEYDVFGKFIAKKLRKLPEHEREDLMCDIHALFRRSHYDRSMDQDHVVVVQESEEIL